MSEEEDEDFPVLEEEEDPANQDANLDEEEENFDDPIAEQDDGEDGEDVVTIKAERDELRKGNKQLYARLKKLQNQNQNKDKTDKSQPTDEIAELNKKVDSLSLSETKRQFGHDHGLSPEETDAVFRIDPKPTKETLEDSFIKGGLQAIRSKKRVARNTPSPSGKMPAINGKEWKDMSPEEKQANHVKLINSRVKR